MKAVILANGVIKNLQSIKKDVASADAVICLDGGLKYAHKLNTLPDIILGDFDSVDKELLDYYTNAGCRVESFPKRKDFTDMEIGLDYAAQAGYGDVVIYGALGGRTDHTFGNVFALIQAVNNGIYPVIADDRERILVTDRTISLTASPGTVISLLPLTPQVSGIVTEGLDYPLKDESLYLGFSRGVSNTFVERKATIHLEAGILLVIIHY